MVEAVSPISYFRQIESQASQKRIASSNEFGRVLDTLDAMEEKYQTYLKTHSTIVRFFLNLCWWKSSTHRSYQAAVRSLAGRVAIGYEDKLYTLVACKHLLVNPLHRNFCSKALDRAVSNIYHRKAEKGFVWRIENQMGVTNYLVGTLHMGTNDMGKVKGVQEAIDHAEEFCTEVGLAGKLSDDTPLKPFPFSFVLDLYIPRHGYEKGKKIYSLDNIELRKRVEMDRRDKNMKSDISFNEVPEPKHFGVNEIQFDWSAKKEARVLSEIADYYSGIQAIGDWKRGDEQEKESISESFSVLCNERTKAWLNSSYDSMTSTQPLPGLIDRIKFATKPICTAVGLSHCIGLKVSLVDEFQKAGFTVSRIE